METKAVLVGILRGMVAIELVIRDALAFEHRRYMGTAKSKEPGKAKAVLFNAINDARSAWTSKSKTDDSTRLALWWPRLSSSRSEASRPKTLVARLYSVPWRNDKMPRVRKAATAGPRLMSGEIRTQSTSTPHAP